MIPTSVFRTPAMFAAFALLVFTALLMPASGFAQSSSTPAAIADLDPSNVLVIEVDGGPIYVELLPDVAPQHVARIQTLAREGFYDGVVFHRVIDGFMAQTGDPTGTGTGGSGYPDLPAEFSQIPYERGVVGMARTNDPNSANSQFFIMFGPAASLNGQYTVFGRVVAGMDAVDAIKKGDARRNGMVTDPDAMIRARLLADLNG
ncbi:peptidylprolyl isomerase [Ahrensia marina]|uniref:peptidylprolyl isomerase n=1 Tax=Ahrensia marina TaxID=1514904 RepID=UPI0035CF33F3